MGFDQMIVFYDHFVVEQAKMRVQFTNLASGAMHCAVRVDADSTPITSVDQLMEFGGLSTDLLEAKNVYGSNKELTISVDMPIFQGIPRRNIMTDPNQRGSPGASPAEITWFHISVWDPLAAGGTVQIDVTIDYHAWFIEPRTAALSARDARQEQERKVNQARTDNELARRNVVIEAMATAAYNAVGDRDVRLCSRR